MTTLEEAWVLGDTARIRYEQTGELEDLERMVTHYRNAAVFCPPGNPYRSSSIVNLGTALKTCYLRLGSIDDLEEAITLLREALTLYPPGHSDRSSCLNNLGLGLHYRYQHMGRIADLEEAITRHYEALSLRPPGHPDRFSSLNNLANALGDWYQQLGKVADLDDSITCHGESLGLCPHGHPNRSFPLINLACALWKRYSHLGRIADLEVSIIDYREGLSLRPPGHPLRSSSLNNLGITLSSRYQQMGRIADLEDSITHYDEALSLRPPGHPDRSSSLNNLAEALRMRYQKLERIADLENSITHLHEALSLRPSGHPRRSNSLSNLATALKNRYQQLSNLADLEESITHQHEALALCLPGHPDRSGLLNNLANALGDRYQRLGSIEDLEDSIAHLNEGLTLCPPGHPIRSSLFSNLADALLTRYSQTRSLEDVQGFFKHIQQAANYSEASLQSRLRAAQRWVSVARDHGDKSLLDAYSMIFRLLDRSLVLYPSIDSQHKFLATANVSVASDAASAAIGAGQLEIAYELLEQGRAILWSKMAGYRHPLDELRQVDEELAHRFEKLSAELEHLALSSESQLLDSDQPKTPLQLENQLQRLRILSEQWEEAVSQVRNKEGFNNFLKAVPFNTLREAAADGPIVVINVSRYRSDAIILLVDSPPCLVPLPDVRPEDLVGLASQLDIARNSPHITNPSKLIFPVLCRLWSDIVYPIVERLEQLGIPKKSRIWWCPTSELCGLPLHAAGPYRRGQKNLPDRYISSYIPTITALIRARSNSIRESVVPKILLIGQPEAALPNLQHEINIIRRRRDFVEVIVGEEASCEKVLDGLRRHSWAHFACHGYPGDNGQPFQAGFQLHGDDDLTLLDLTRARLQNAELAFLSACHSAAADSSTPDETISLAAALQFCGFRSVVGTLWEMEDEVGPIISEAFYKHMFRNPGNKADFRDSAEALNIAIRRLRRLKAPLKFWIMFVHIGA